MYRSRLQKTEEKRNLKWAIWMILGGLALVVVMIVWGLPLLVKLAVFIGDLNSSRKPIDKTDLIPPAPPQLAVEYVATNSATQQIYGSTEPGATVYLSQNTKGVANIVAQEDGRFVFNDVLLELGVNEFTAVAMDRGGNSSQPSFGVKIVYSIKQPKLELETPTDGQKVTGSEPMIEVKGKTDPGVRLILNDRLVMVNSQGEFVTKIKLNEGENQLTISATDKSGNAATKQLVVTYTKS